MHNVHLQVISGSQFQMGMVQTNLREQFTRQYISANITFWKFLLCPSGTLVEVVIHFKSNETSKV